MPPALLLHLPRLVGDKGLREQLGEPGVRTRFLGFRRGWPALVGGRVGVVSLVVGPMTATARARARAKPANLRGAGKFAATNPFGIAVLPRPTQTTGRGGTTEPSCFAGSTNVAKALGPTKSSGHTRLTSLANVAQEIVAG